jgi:hypothetical protein
MEARPEDCNAGFRLSLLKRESPELLIGSEKSDKRSGLEVCEREREGGNRKQAVSGPCTSPSRRRHVRAVSLPALVHIDHGCQMIGTEPG